MRSQNVGGKGLLISAGVVLLSVCATSTGSKALGIDIFSIIDSTISRDIGGALTAMNTVQSALRQDQQAILAPVALINQSHNYVNAIMSNYRGWMSGVFALAVNSAQLPGSQGLERVFLGGSLNRLLLTRRVRGNVPADLLLACISEEEHGRILFDSDWRSPGVRILSSSEFGRRQQSLVLMPSDGIINTEIGEWRCSWTGRRATLTKMPANVSAITTPRISKESEFS